MERVGILPLVALITFVVDQVSKIVVVFWLDLITLIEMDVLPPFLVFRMAWNDGMNFGLFGDDSPWVRWVLIAVAVAISAWVWIWVRREAAGVWAQAAAGLLIGGALGNVVDRIAYGAVVDFVLFHVETGLHLELAMFPLYALCFYLPLVPWERWRRA